MLFSHLMIPLKSEMDWKFESCVRDADYGNSRIVSSEAPAQVECEEGTRVLQTSFSRFAKRASPAFLQGLPAGHKFLSVAFYS